VIDNMVAIGDNIPQAWEHAIDNLVHYGRPYHGRYWTPDKPVGRTSRMTLIVKRANAEPRVHKGATMDVAAIAAYVEEIMYGTDRAWEYTYYRRMRQYEAEYGDTIDQLQYVFDCLRRKPSSHKAVITFGKPALDSVNAGEGTHIPCLRELSFQVFDDTLDMISYWRAHNAMHASLPNMIGLSFLQEYVADELGLKTGSYTEFNADYHINGTDMPYAINFLEANKTRRDRYWTWPEVLEMLES